MLCETETSSQSVSPSHGHAMVRRSTLFDFDGSEQWAVSIFNYKRQFSLFS